MNTSSAQINVVGFPKQSAKDIMEMVINKHESINTKDAYFRHLKRLCMFVYGKTIEDISFEELKSIDEMHVERFINHLMKQYKKATVSQNIFSCKSMWDELKFIHLVDNNPFDLPKKIKVYDKDVDHHGSLTEEEVYQLYDYCESLPDRGLTKRLYFEFLVVMSCRKSIAQNLKMDEIKWRKNRADGKSYWTIKKFDKTQTMDKAITEDFYRRLRNNFNSYNEKDRDKGYVFNVENQTLKKTLDDFCKLYGIDQEERNIHQHSLKSSAADIIYYSTENLVETANACGHAHIDTLYKNYLGKNKDYSKQPSFAIWSTQDTSELENLSKEELIKLIEACGSPTVVKILKKAEDMKIKGLLTREEK